LTILELEGGYGLKITTARYYTPNGRSIQAKGIVPDVELKNISLEDAISEAEAEPSLIKTTIGAPFNTSPGSALNLMLLFLSLLLV
jgi:C-terminal processing protease CtpA/Prc